MTEAATREVERDMAKPCTSSKGGASKSRSTPLLESGGSLRMPLSLRRGQRGMGMDRKRESALGMGPSGSTRARFLSHRFAHRSAADVVAELVSLPTCLAVFCGPGAKPRPWEGNLMRGQGEGRDWLTSSLA